MVNLWGQHFLDFHFPSNILYKRQYVQTSTVVLVINIDLFLFAPAQKMKGLMRKRSGTASRLQRALSAKSLRHEDPPRTPAPGTDTRTFLMEAPVQFCTVSKQSLIHGNLDSIFQKTFSLHFPRPISPSLT